MEKEFTIVTGAVTDHEGNPIQGAKITVSSTEDEDDIQYYTSKDLGKFSFQVKLDDNYNVLFMMQGFAAHVEHLSVIEINAFETIERPVELRPSKNSEFNVNVPNPYEEEIDTTTVSSVTQEAVSSNEQEDVMVIEQIVDSSGNSIIKYPIEKVEQMGVLESKNVKLRALEPNDLEMLYGWYNTAYTGSATNRDEPVSRHDLQMYILESGKDIYARKHLHLVIDVKDKGVQESIGSIEFFDYEPRHQRCGINMLINSSQRDQFASEALQVAIHYAFHILNMHQLYCNVAANDEKSIDLFQRLGFQQVGEKKDWIRSNEGWTDELMLQLINDNEP